MKTITLEIREDQWLQDILSEIPTNTFLFKNITGIGATNLELISKRNSVIIEPYVPVIHCKSDKHKYSFGVFEGISQQQIVKYLKNEKIEYKKLITTPESFKKVIDAFNELGIDYLNEYFLLFDEFEKMSSDIDFRDEIIYPMHLFFNFRGKALVSATGYTPLDPRFEQFNFQILNIVPTYSIARDINLITTNSVLDAFNKKLQLYGQNKIFVFFNSPSNIADYIKSLDIENDSALFTSVEEVNEFYNKRTNINLAHLGSELDEKYYQKYNFLTSRYFCAIDIDIKEDVDVFILSDIIITPHTIINPTTDSVQIIGRFREEQVVKSITVITNINPSISFKSYSESLAYLKGCNDVFQQIIGLKLASKNHTEIEVIDGIVIKELLQKLFINTDYTPNYFKWDNYIENNQINSYYQSKEKLIEQYRSTYAFGTEITYFNVIHEQIELINANKKLNRINTSLPFKERLDAIIILLNNIQTEKKLAFDNKVYVIDNSDRLLQEIQDQHPEICEVYFNEGEKELRKIAKTLARLKKYHSLHYNSELLTNFPMVKELYQEIDVGVTYTKVLFLDKFYSISKKYNSKIKRSMDYAKRYFEVIETKPRINGKQVERIQITSFKYSLN